MKTTSASLLVPLDPRPDQPGAWVAWGAVAWPSVGGDGERLLRGFLGEVEVPEETVQDGQHATPSLTEDLVECPYQ